ncbi:MAG: hypothetical protein H6714_06620 [Myxococcales bacterium]|nr:hypothetical protein [Myxococcales bacterium]
MLFILAFASLGGCLAKDKYHLPHECADGCPTDRPLCSEVLERCVQCLENSDCKDPERPLCQVSTGKCGACLESGDCTEKEHARCDAETLACTTCEKHADCANIAGTEACGPTGVCVECTPDNEAACEGKVCDPDTLTCSSSIERGKTGTCQSCLTDTQCIAAHKCIPLAYQESPHGNYCMKLKSAGCAEPHQLVIPRKSVLSANDDAPEEYCGLNESLATCEAILAFNRECDSMTDASKCDADGAICREVNGAANRCTYYCQNATQCQPGIVCASSSDPFADNNYCGK